MMYTKIMSTIWISVIITCCSSCGHKEDGQHEGHQTINHKLNAKSVDSIQYEVTTEDYFKGLEKVLAEVPDQEFYIPKRTNLITSFPCNNCHSKALDELKITDAEKVKNAHWNIKMTHANANVMECTTCHSEKNVTHLKSITGKAISLNHSYKLCAQCHSSQYKDWQGGAHGKRLGGWAPPKVINSCVNCHNPHSPAFESKWPARLNTVKLKEQSKD
ncbi:MAG: hypothetical protein ABJF11_15160 [Reichenbachiella sp.]|uniref:hypothetical protein n=1 Tax=Reichenbachiella sp. TaxID=2184521 RepID=UPI003265D87F